MMQKDSQWANFPTFLDHLGYSPAMAQHKKD